MAELGAMCNVKASYLLQFVLSKYVNAKIQERTPLQLAIFLCLSLVLLPQLFYYVSFSLFLVPFLPPIIIVIFSTL